MGGMADRWGFSYRQSCHSGLSVETGEAGSVRLVALVRVHVHRILGTQMPLAEHVGLDAVLVEHVGYGRVLEWDMDVGVRKADGRLCDAGHAVAGMVAPGHQAGE